MIKKIKDWLNSDHFEGFNYVWYSILADLEYAEQELFLRKIIECHRLGIIHITADDILRMMRNEKSTIEHIELLTDEKIATHYLDRKKGPWYKASFKNNGLWISVYIVLQLLHTLLTEKRLPYIMEIYGSVVYIFRASNNRGKSDVYFEELLKCRLLDRCIDKQSCDLHNRRLIYMRKRPRNEGEGIRYDILLTIYEDNKTVLRFVNKTQSETEQYKKQLFNDDNLIKIGYHGNELIIPPILFEKVKDFTFESCLDIAIQNGPVTSDNKDKFYCLSSAYPRWIKFCEGKDAENLHKLWQKPFKWCSGYACFRCEGLKSSEKGRYKDYTIYDFVEILQPQNITKNDVLLWYSTINNFYSQLPHMHCRDCNTMLEPLKWSKESRSWEPSTYHARYITRFGCSNPGCPQHKKPIYISRCFVRSCKEIIDERDTKKCTNGFNICKICGACCAELQFELKRQAGILSPFEKGLIDSHKLHLDGTDTPKFFCPKCGSQLIEQHIEPKYTFTVKREGRTTTIELSKYHQCPKHNDYYGIFPRTNYKDENKALSDFIKQQNNGDNLMVDDLPM